VFLDSETLSSLHSKKPPGIPLPFSMERSFWRASIPLYFVDPFPLPWKLISLDNLFLFIRQRLWDFAWSNFPLPGPFGSRPPPLLNPFIFRPSPFFFVTIAPFGSRLAGVLSASSSPPFALRVAFGDGWVLRLMEAANRPFFGGFFPLLVFS